MDKQRLTTVAVFGPWVGGSLAASARADLGTKSEVRGLPRNLRTPPASGGTAPRQCNGLTALDCALGISGRISGATGGPLGLQPYFERFAP